MVPVVMFRRVWDKRIGLTTISMDGRISGGGGGGGGDVSHFWVDLPRDGGEQDMMMMMSNYSYAVRKLKIGCRLCQRMEFN